VSRNELTRFF